MNDIGHRKEWGAGECDADMLQKLGARKHQRVEEESHIAPVSDISRDGPIYN